MLPYGRPRSLADTGYDPQPPETLPWVRLGGHGVLGPAALNLPVEHAAAAREVFAAVTIEVPSPSGTNALVFLHDDFLSEMQDTVVRHPNAYPATWLLFTIKVAHWRSTNIKV